MKNDYKLSIEACDLPSDHLEECKARVRIMNKLKHLIQQWIDEEDGKINVHDYTFVDWDFEKGSVRVLYNPHPSGVE